ncbi:MAG: DUF2795 domain-containing protein [Chloroflexi bacterium]|nr:MAG: DUF2795 domain-containing protein [Chloroflexota bacterium]TMG51771.1 MAG: DUF2795 domain-containing protein [Chloroflexota bacterium]
MRRLRPPRSADRNPLFASGPPGLGRLGRLPVARGPSVGRAPDRAGMRLALPGRMQEMRASEVASQFVDGLDYPISRDAILEAAREASIDQTVFDSLKKLPDREYSAPEELTRALNAAN